MAQVIGIWSAVLKPDEPVIVDAPAAIRILNVSLGDDVADANGRSVVKLTYESLNIPNDEDESDEEKEDDEDLPLTTTPICALTAGKTETVTIDLVLEGESAYKLEVSGKNTVYLSGNYIDQDMDQEPSSDDEFDSDDEGYRLEDVSSDVEMDINDLDGLDTDASRFEEVEEPAPAKGQKRPRDTEDAKADEGKASKKTKKQKAEAEDKSEAKKEEKKEEKKKGKKDAEASKGDAATTFNTPGGVVVKEVKVGNGPEAKKGQTVSMRYIGRLQNGKIFDQNIKGKPFVFHLGKGEVIKGWDEGIAGMRVGGERLLTIPPGLGYGKKGTDGIPGNATLTFEVKLLQIK